MGCRAMEVTMDSTDWAAVVGQLRQKLPPEIVLGIGTVMDDTVSELGRAAALGVTFALSPIDPIGFVDECHRRGIVAVPSALSSNEMWQLHRRGTRLIKLFHAGTVGPATLKSMLGVGPLGTLKIMPSGGVDPANAFAWLDAGAFVVGMGSNLVGDISVVPGGPRYEKAMKDWESKGRGAAQELFKSVQKRFP